MVDISKEISVVNSKEKTALMKGGACHQTGNRIRREREKQSPPQTAISKEDTNLACRPGFSHGTIIS